MYKYIIKNADGSEQTVMQAVHESRKEAGRVLMINLLQVLCMTSIQSTLKYWML